MINIAERVPTTPSERAMGQRSARQRPRSRSGPTSCAVSSLTRATLACLHNSQPLMSLTMPDKSQRPGLILAVLSFAAFMASLDVFIVNVAFDAIGADFHGTTLAQLSWVLNAYAIVYAALLIPAGRVADRYGRKGGFLIGLTVFTLARAACAATGGGGWRV